MNAIMYGIADKLSNVCAIFDNFVDSVLQFFLNLFENNVIMSAFALTIVLLLASIIFTAIVVIIFNLRNKIKEE